MALVVPGRGVRMNTGRLVRDVVAVLVIGTVCMFEQATAQIRSRALREITEALVRRAPAGMTREMAEALADDLLKIAARHGDDLVAAACKKVPPQVLVRLMREAGTEGEQAILKILARYGDNAVWIVQRPRALAIFMKFGDEAGEALVKHGAIAEPLIENYGTPAAKAIRRLNGQNARRLAILHEEGVLQKMPHREEVMDVIARYGDRAADWVWRNKGAILVTSVAAGFVANPEGFLTGTSQLVEAVTEPVSRAINTQLGAFVFGMGVVLGGAAVVLVLFKAIRRGAGDFLKRWWQRRRQRVLPSQPDVASAKLVSE